MSTKVHVQRVLVIAVLIAALPTTAGAQFKVGAKAKARTEAALSQHEADVDAAITASEEGEYAEELSPGLNIRPTAASNGQSALGAAARERRSLVIGSDIPTERRVAAAPRANYIVREGDTLYDICEKIWGDPYLWPRLWALNGQITNPNWIYPGDVLRLQAQANGDPSQAPTAAAAELAMPSPALVPAVGDAILLRNRGFVDKEALKQSGTLVGAHRPVAMLAEFDEAYVEFGPDARVAPGAEFVAFKILGEVDPIEGYDDEGIDDPESEHGVLVEILADVRVLSYDPDKRMARVYIQESMKAISRGTMIGPVHRKFDLVAPVTNAQTVEGHIIAALDPTIMVATHQVVFVDIGLEDGVRDGNRLFAVENRDRFRASRNEKDDREGYPTEVTAELRVIEARPHTATCLITSSITEIEKGQIVQMRAGY